MSREKKSRTEPQSPTGWRNRIVDHAVMPVAELRANEKNWRLHPKQQEEALRGTLEEVGVVQGVIVNRRSAEQGWPPESVPTLVDGHLRVELAHKNGEASLPVAVVDLNPAEEALVLATLDPVGAMATADPDVLAALLGEIPVQANGDLQALLDALQEQAGVVEPEIEAGEDPGADMDRASELREKWGTEQGQLWLIPSATVPEVQMVTCPHCSCTQPVRKAG